MKLVASWREKGLLRPSETRSRLRLEHEIVLLVKCQPFPLLCEDSDPAKLLHNLRIAVVKEVGVNV